MEIGGTIRAKTRIDVIGGHSNDGVGVKMPGGARLATAHEDGVINISAEQDAEILGLVVAGGEVIDHYDSLGFYRAAPPATSAAIPSSPSWPTTSAPGRDLMAGKTIDVRGGSGRAAPLGENEPDDWIDEGVVVGGNVHLSTGRNSAPSRCRRAAT
ncbi:hypothetical protein HK414_16035 [Ramlibacter terrae]|uniref:Uncharacterized protein n=1 Tax=Ramlibacter terrae TaxID=2732511 RepID=A0ABX6P3M5_9BURK|nr:hypothetical protein HK414_16035 [Ramlibacter terrae]